MIETFNNSAIGEPAIGYSDKPGNEGISEAVNEALNKRLTDLDFRKAEKVYCNVFLRKEVANYRIDSAKDAIMRFFPQSSIPIHFFLLEKMESEVTAVFLIINAPRRTPSIEELGMDVIK